MKPMLLPKDTPDLDTLKYPVYVSPKLDGVRCLFDNGVALSRTLKPIPNKHIQAWALENKQALQGRDGELIVGSPTSPSVYRDTTSFIMSHDKTGMFQFYVFDRWDYPDTPYSLRLEYSRLYKTYRAANLISMLADSKEKVLSFEQMWLREGYEGIIIRNPEGKYKYGRCTMKEANAYKLKRFEDDEAVIIGFEEEMHNGNEAEVNELGRTKRSTSKSGLTGKGSLGALVCETPDKVRFSIGSGFTQQDRLDFWCNQKALMGCTVKYKHFPIGVKDKPRHPIFLGFRAKIDIGENE